MEARNYRTLSTYRAMHCGSVGSDSECCPSEGPLAGLGCGPSWALICSHLSAFDWMSWFQIKSTVKNLGQNKRTSCQLFVKKKKKKSSRIQKNRIQMLCVTISVFLVCFFFSKGGSLYLIIIQWSVTLPVFCSVPRYELWKFITVHYIPSLQTCLYVRIRWQDRISLANQ